jgi:hypothetical protein
MLRLGALLLGSAAACAHAQGGPPFLTDDPATPGNRHWEINFGWNGDRNPALGCYEVPNIDINYGLGDRIQLKYEVPLVLIEVQPQPAKLSTPAQPGHLLGGLGNSMLGLKWRFLEHRPGGGWFRRGSSGSSRPEEDLEEPSLSISTYPQLSFNNPTHSAARDIVEPGTSFFLPVEISGRIGAIRLNGEVGYSFGNHELAQSWSRGLLIGREFNRGTEAYLELYDWQTANRMDDLPKERKTTLGIGGRQTLNRHKTLLLLLMGGRSFQKVSAENSQPSWIAYAGWQMLLGPRER